jgi:hypothetical protein
MTAKDPIKAMSPNKIRRVSTELSGSSSFGDLQQHDRVEALCFHGIGHSAPKNLPTSPEPYPRQVRRIIPSFVKLSLGDRLLCNDRDRTPEIEPLWFSLTPIQNFNIKLCPNKRDRLNTCLLK